MKAEYSTNVSGEYILRIIIGRDENEMAGSQVGLKAMELAAE